MDDPKRDLNMSTLYVGGDGDASAVARMLRKGITRLYGMFLGDDGRSLDRAGLVASPEFAQFEADVTHLQRVDLGSLDSSARTAFFINVYNVLCVHGQVVHGPPSSVLARRTFFKRTRYTIGLFSYSLDDIEHGILRCNIGNHMEEDDPRLAYMPDSRDPRIHFALNCGAESCPPIRVYSGEDPDAFESELDLAAQVFCESEISLIKLAGPMSLSTDSIDSSNPPPPAQGEQTSGKTTIDLKLSKIFMWYHDDFGPTDLDLIRFVLPWMEPSLRSSIQDTVMAPQDESDLEIRIQYAPYSWKAV